LPPGANSLYPDADPLRPCPAGALQSAHETPPKLTPIPAGHIELSVGKAKRHPFALSVKDRRHRNLARVARPDLRNVFRKVEDITARSAGGLGIGLAPGEGKSRNWHGGTIDVWKKPMASARGQRIHPALITRPPPNRAQWVFAAKCLILIALTLAAVGWEYVK